MSYPATTADPAVGAASVHSILMVVVLPAPFGAEEPEDLARLDVERDLVHGGEVAVALDQADHRYGRRRLTISLQP